MVQNALNVKFRIIENNKYNPNPKANRKMRCDEKSGKIQTYKKKGDIIITNSGKVEVTRNGWY